MGLVASDLSAVLTTLVATGVSNLPPWRPGEPPGALQPARFAGKINPSLVSL